MVAACEAAGVPLFVAYYRRALPRFEFVRARLATAASASRRSSSASCTSRRRRAPSAAGWRWDPAVGGDGLLLDVGSHGLDLLDHWFGPIAEVRGFAASRSRGRRVTDEVVAAFRFESGVHGVGTWGFAGTHRRDRIDDRGHRGPAHVPLFADGPVASPTRAAPPPSTRSPIPPTSRSR
jgi:1,5-anhydro-D-fructose reductase (1,5-anhydro-D-mannitol-forming)